MAQSHVRTKFVTIFSLAIFILFFLQMLWIGQTLALSLFFASIMGLMTADMATMSYAYKAYLQRRSFSGKKQSSQSMSNHQQRTVEIDVPMNVAFDMAHDALKTLDNKPVPVPDDLLVKLESILPRKQYVKIRESDKAFGIIRAGLKPKTLGLPNLIDFSKIEIRLRAIDSQTTQIHIESKGNNFFDMYDLGKNLHYVNEIALHLRRESQQESASSRLIHSQPDEIHDDDTDSSAQQQTS
jgi:hypothetical protein